MWSLWEMGLTLLFMAKVPTKYVASCSAWETSQNVPIVIRQRCGKAVGGRIWLDDCYLWYNNSNFIRQRDVCGIIIFDERNVSNVDPQAFNAALNTLLNSLSAEVENIPSKNQYASGTTADNFFPKIYSFVQCTRDISIDDYTTCLTTTISEIETYYYGRKGVDDLEGH